MATIKQKQRLKEKYFQSKEELDKIRSDETLLKWKVLSEAYKLGKKIWGPEFGVVRLAKDMELPYTTTYRCLSLDRANKRSWELLGKGKISAFKLAMICSLKDSTYQDEIVDAVIKDNIPTHQIKGLKPKNIKDINEWRHKRAVEKGYSREDSAFRQMTLWISRGDRFLLMPMSTYSPEHRETILKSLKRLYTKIGKVIEKNG